ncbi:AraC family transcriptional regulator [Ruegeria arenilitoris]|uniref:AraC family transcriptional regulator n=1 Tax=Ruegeria arenilitoris TaxID=1173585 RepID=UPI0014799A9A|nr:AraC family transcriptional regulator [Ruegeria arenilitoris]
MNKSKTALTTLPVMQSKFLAEVIDRACKLGADRNQILKGCLLRPTVFDEPSQSIPSACVYLASTQAAVLSGNPYLCAEIGREYEWSIGFVPPTTMSNTPSLGDLLVAWMHFVETVQVSMRYQLIVDAERANLVGKRFLKASQPPGQADAWDVVAWSEMLKTRLGTVWDQSDVEIHVFDPHAIPEELVPSSNVKKGDAWGLRMSFPAAWLMQQSPFPRNTEPDNTSMQQQPLDLVALFRVFDYSDWPGLDGLAEFAGTHPKALQRELAQHGTNGAELIDRAKEHLADLWLREEIRTITQIGRDLGYKNASAFTRACHRWFGASPEKLRRRYAPVAQEQFAPF